MISLDQRGEFLTEMDKLLDHLILKRGIKDQPRLKEEIIGYIDVTILRPMLEQLRFVPPEPGDYTLIPERIMNNLLYYVSGEEVPGGFLYSILCNDLFGAIGKADREMLPLIPLLVRYIHWEVPGGCHGSPGIVEAWMKKKQDEKKTK